MSAAGLILTPTDRLARALREQYAVARQRAGEQVWQPPNIKSLRQWLQDSWTQAWPAEQLLNSSQQLALWLEAVEADNHALISPRSCAREAMQAARVAAQWRINLEQLNPWTDEHRAWLKWHAQVRQRMDKQRWLVAEDIYGIVSQWIADGSLKLPDHITLKGFGPGTNALEQAVLDTLAQHTQVSEEAYTPIAEPNRQCLSFADNPSQYRHIADTVRKRLQATLDEPDQLPRILIVCPDDSDAQASLQTALTDLVAPWLRHAEGSETLPWRWQNGQPFNENPWVDSALAVISLDEYDNRPEIVSRVLLSSTLWSEQSRQACARIEYRLRGKGYPRPSLHTLIKESSPDADEAAPGWLEAIKDSIHAEPRNALPSDWAQHFEKRLEIIGWPGSETLSSSAFQHVRELRAELARLASLDAMLGSVSINGARKWLNELCQRRFTPRAEYQQPVHILSPRDLDDVRLDQPGDLLIIADASADIYPGTAMPTPFLPIDAQIAVGVPEARAETLLKRQQQRLGDALANSRETLLCVCQQSEDGADRLPTPLIQLNWEPAESNKDPISATEQMAAASKPTTLPDADPVPAVIPQEQLHGSTALFQLWAESPFLSFCRVRLGIRPMPIAGRGLPNSIQGTLLHLVLDRIMGERIHGSDQLKGLDDESLSNLVSSILVPLMQTLLPEAEYGRDLIRLEQGRMQDLLLQWLKHEQRRIHAFRVVEHETELRGRLANLPMEMRIDRVDEVSTEQGPRYLVIDYKTGREVKPAGWKADSLKEPQLPLYAILGADEARVVPSVDGICFAHLKDGHPALSACTNWTLGLIPSDKPAIRHKLEDWPQLLNEWRSELEKIAADFMAGVAWLDSSQINARSFNADYQQLAGTVASGDEE